MEALNLANDAFDQVAHALEFNIGLLEALAFGDHHFACVVLQFACKNIELVAHHEGLHAVGLLFGGSADTGAIG